MKPPAKPSSAGPPTIKRRRRVLMRVYLYGVALVALMWLALFAVARLYIAPAVTASVRPLAGWIVPRAEVAEARDKLRVELTLYDAEGRLLATNVEPPLAALAPDDVARLRAEPMLTLDDSPVIAVAVLEGSELAGYALMTRPPRNLALKGSSIAFVAVLIVLAFGAVPLARSIVGPLEKLAGVARAFGQGDLAARAGPYGNDELGDLGRAFDEMADRVTFLLRAEKELLANVSHELRSPLARIRVALALLAPGGENDRRLADVERDLAELEKLIEDVLTTARLDASGLPARLGTVDTRALLAELAERARHDPLTAGATVSVEDGPAIELLADEALLRRALWNLIENAAKYGAPPIVLAAARAGPRVEFIVRDAGAGVAPVDRERVFAPFYRADSARTPAPEGDLRRGVGLGLTLARRVAEVHGGTITIGADTAPDGRQHGCRVVLTV